MYLMTRACHVAYPSRADDDPTDTLAKLWLAISVSPQADILQRHAKHHQQTSCSNRSIHLHYLVLALALVIRRLVSLVRMHRPHDGVCQPLSRQDTTKVLLRCTRATSLTCSIPISKRATMPNLRDSNARLVCTTRLSAQRAPSSETL